ncbi:MAG TPA: DNA gyrase inhibitor YacG [Casimicrobiaceae bacterium]|nr:DNA gyrase inhibitor YacG [Casimicrobiaceae bacterium]
MTPNRTVACPTCGKQVAWTPESTWRPFCSERCKLIDFGAWANESYRIPAVDNDDDEEPLTGGDREER